MLHLPAPVDGRGGMTAIRYLEGIASALVVGGGLWAITGTVRERFLPDWHGAPRRLARVILGIGILVCVSEALGTIGQLHVPALVATMGVLGLIAVGSARLQGPPRPKGVDEQPASPDEGRREGRWERVGALVSVALVTAEWSPATINAFRTGMANIDSLWYHMPIAAGFAQSGSVLGLHNINNDNVIAFYPATSELIHAVGIELMGSDVLSLVVNMAWLALALFAAWCLGIRYDVGCLAVMGTALVMGTTEFVASEPGGAYDDVVGIALLLSALALMAWVSPRRNRRSDIAGFLVAALATGLALGVKYTFVVPAVALTLAAIALIPRGHRIRMGTAWSGVVIIGGGLWYLRNFVDAGNPLPNLHVSVGGLHLPSPTTTPSVTVWHVIFHRDVWTADVLPGLSQAFGPGWWLLTVTAAVGLVAALLSGVGPLWTALTDHPAQRAHPRDSTGPAGIDPSGAGADERGPSAVAMSRLLSFVGTATLAGYLVTPEPNLPVSLVYDLRFLGLTVLLGILVLPLLTAGTRRSKAVLVLFGALIIATQFAKGIWWGSPSLVAFHSPGEGALVGAIVLLVGGLRMVFPRADLSWPRPATTAAVALLACVAAVGGIFIERSYLTNRYSSVHLPGVIRWASTVHGARVGVANMTLNYPLYGSDLTNDVIFIGTPGPDGSYSTIVSCGQWRRAINEGHFQYVVSDIPLPTEAAHSTTHWTASDPDARLVVSSLAMSATGLQQIDVFRIDGRLDPSTC